MDPAAPQSPFAAPWTLTPNPTVFFGPNGVTLDSNQAIFGHAGNGEVVCGDIGGQGTQMDALGHFGFINAPGDTPTYFGGLTQSAVVGPAGLTRLGIDKADPIVTSVVMLDAARYLNNGNALAPGQAITRAEIESMLSAQGLAPRGIKEGDVVFIHTGYGAAWASSPSTYYTQGPGLAHEAAVFLASRKIALVGLDNPFTDAAVNDTRRRTIPSPAVLGEWRQSLAAVRSTPPQPHASRRSPDPESESDRDGAEKDPPRRGVHSAHSIQRGSGKPGPSRRDRSPE